MVQAMDNTVNRPIYNAVKINIKKPEVNAGENNSNTIINDNGIYNAVNIDIDNPSVNSGSSKKIYDYPQAESLVTYDMANLNPIELPKGFHVAYQTTNVILPKIENEVEIESAEEESEAEETEEAEEAEPQTVNKTSENTTEETDIQPIPVMQEEDEENNIKPEEDTAPEVPQTNYTTVEAEKGNTAPVDTKENIEETKTIQRPEIIPEEEITPDVDVPLVVSNLNNPDFDIQAQQMEEIARISLDNPENAVPYIVSDIFASLMEITKKDSARLAPPTEEQVQARRKMIANFIVSENARRTNTPVQLPYTLTENEIAIAGEISPMEQAERNKEYALYTMAILAKVYTDEVEKQTGNIVPLTDIPGTAVMVDALRYSPNPGVKVAAVDALRYIQRPEYKNELATLFTLAQSDSNQQVVLAATQALERINNQ